MGDVEAGLERSCGPSSIGSTLEAGYGKLSRRRFFSRTPRFPTRICATCTSIRRTREGTPSPRAPGAHPTLHKGKSARS